MSTIYGFVKGYKRNKKQLPHLSVEDVEAVDVGHVLEGVRQPPAHPDGRRRHSVGRGDPRAATQRVPSPARRALGCGRDAECSVGPQPLGIPYSVVK